MTDLGTDTSGSTALRVRDLAAASDLPLMTLPGDDVERVTIEEVHVGDYVFLDSSASPTSACRVIKKCAKTNERAARVVGWLVELTGGQLAWWAHGAPVWRRKVRGSTSVPVRRAWSWQFG